MVEATKQPDGPATSASAMAGFSAIMEQLGSALQGRGTALEAQRLAHKERDAAFAELAKLSESCHIPSRVRISS